MMHHEILVHAEINYVWVACEHQEDDMGMVKITFTLWKATNNNMAGIAS